MSLERLARHFESLAADHEREAQRFTAEFGPTCDTAKSNRIVARTYRIAARRLREEMEVDRVGKAG